MINKSKVKFIFAINIENKEKINIIRFQIIIQ